MIGIYKIISPSGKIYIGQSLNIKNRFYQYKCKKRNSVGPKLTNSLIKYGFENHQKEILEECSKEQLNEREVYWKQYYLNLVGGDWTKVLFHELHDKGGGFRSEETRRKISESNKGKKVSSETKLKKSLAMLGKSHSDLTKEKMRNSSLGKKKSKNHIQNMMDNRENVIKGVKLANSKSIFQYDLSGNFIAEFFSITEAKKIYKGDISACCLNKQKTASGYIWKFKNKI